MCFNIFIFFFMSITSIHKYHIICVGGSDFVEFIWNIPKYYPQKLKRIISSFSCGFDSQRSPKIKKNKLYQI